MIDVDKCEAQLDDLAKQKLSFGEVIDLVQATILLHILKLIMKEKNEHTSFDPR